MVIPKWVTPERQAELVRLFAQSQGFCVHVNKPCQGRWETKTLIACQWGNVCDSPVPDGEPCRYEPEQGKPHLPCHVIHLNVTHWRCGYGDYPCYYPHECHYELYADRLIKEWVQSDRAIKQAKLEAEQKELHSLGERRTPLRGRFNNISRDIYYPKQPAYYLDGLGMSGLTFKPFAKVKVAGSYVHLYIDLGDTLKVVSKSKRRKAIRYGKPLPKDVTGTVDDICNRAVRRYLKY